MGDSASGVDSPPKKNPWVCLGLQDSAFFQWSANNVYGVRQLRRDSKFDILDVALQSYTNYVPRLEPECEAGDAMVLGFDHQKHYQPHTEVT
ncbi:hypothetical protein ACHHYP_20417 [Achlya hypogyna]|uniref:Uncharacterized protein n=1 Tax=Achlya hypogyna TaxID=1202772 RepID=A0A1V9ZIX7_ACHHY|nr:hypothetical protein ACHHYP_20417 [Achlya hypogyna]